MAFVFAYAESRFSHDAAPIRWVIEMCFNCLNYVCVSELLLSIPELLPRLVGLAVSKECKFDRVYGNKLKIPLSSASNMCTEIHMLRHHWCILIQKCPQVCT